MKCECSGRDVLPVDVREALWSIKLVVCVGAWVLRAVDFYSWIIRRSEDDGRAVSVSFG